MWESAVKKRSLPHTGLLFLDFLNIQPTFIIFTNILRDFLCISFIFFIIFYLMTHWTTTESVLTLPLNLMKVSRNKICIFHKSTAWDRWSAGNILGQVPTFTQPKCLHNVGENLNKSTSKHAFSPLKRLVSYSVLISYSFVARNFLQCTPQVRHNDWSHLLHLHIEPLQSSVSRSECHHIMPPMVTICPEHRHNKRHYDSLCSLYLEIKLHHNVVEFYFFPIQSALFK